MILNVISFVFATLLSYFLNRFFLRFSKNLGVHNSNDGTVIRWGSRSKPTIGGLSFFIVFILAFIIYTILPITNFKANFEDFGLLSSITLGFLIGLADDAYNTRPLLKFLGQVFTGVVLIAFGIRIELFDIYLIDAALTIFWVVGIMNSINLLDNMDAVTGSLSTSILIVLSVVLALGGMENSIGFFLTITSIGSFLGFLYWNWNPSKLYMGDTGSQFLGALLAAIGIKYFWNIELGEQEIFSFQVLTPVMLFIVPIMDTTFVFAARIARGQSPFIGGKDHIAHHMSFIGIKQRYVPIILSFVTLVSGILITSVLIFARAWNHTFTAIFAIYIALIVGVFALLYKKGAKVRVVIEKREQVHKEIKEIKEKKLEKAIVN